MAHPSSVKKPNIFMWGRCQTTLLSIAISELLARPFGLTIGAMNLSSQELLRQCS